MCLVVVIVIIVIIIIVADWLLAGNLGNLAGSCDVVVCVWGLIFSVGWRIGVLTAAVWC